MQRKQCSTWIVILMSFALVACDQGPAQEHKTVSRAAENRPNDNILDYIPADTGYLIGKFKPFSNQAQQSIDLRMRSGLEAAEALMAINVADLTADQPNTQRMSEAGMLRLIRSLKSLSSAQQREQIGLSPQSNFAFYGHGIVPVFRMKIQDQSKFKAFVRTFEQANNLQTQSRQVNATEVSRISYQQYSIDYMVEDNQFVAALSLDGFNDADTARHLGLLRSKKTIADSGKIESLRQAQNYLLESIGFIDIEGIISNFIDGPSENNQRLFDLNKIDNTALSEQCKSQYRAIAALMPTVSTGLTAIDGQSQRLKSVAELAPTIANDIQAISTTVPGLGQPTGAMFSIGAGIKLDAAKALLLKWTEDYQATGSNCLENLVSTHELNQLRSTLNRPLPPMAGNFLGFILTVDNVSQLLPIPKNLKARALLSIKDAPALIEFASLFIPELKQVDPRSGAEPVKLNIPQLSMFGINDLYIAATKDAIAVGVGLSEAAQLSKMLTADSVTPSPLLAIEFDQKRYLTLLAENMASIDPKASAQSAIYSALAESSSHDQIQLFATETGLVSEQVTTY